MFRFLTHFPSSYYSSLPLTYYPLANWPFIFLDALKSHLRNFTWFSLHRMSFTLLLRQVPFFLQVSACLFLRGVLLNILFKIVTLFYSLSSFHSFLSPHELEIIYLLLCICLLDVCLFFTLFTPLRARIVDF